MPVHKVGNKYAIGKGRAMYRTKKSAESAYRGYLYSKYGKGESVTATSVLELLTDTATVASPGTVNEETPAPGEVDDKGASVEDAEQQLDADREETTQNNQNKVRKLALKYEKGNYSYLYWPCTMKVTDEPGLHVTAKFFGENPIEVEEVRHAIESIEGFDQPFDVSELEWEPVVFPTKNDGKVPVLELKNAPEAIRQVHAALSKFRRDDYDSYRPHITVSEEVWGLVKEKGITPKQAGLEFGPLELCIHGLVRYKWGEDAGPVEEIDGEDVSTENPTESFAGNVVKGLEDFFGK